MQYLNLVIDPSLKLSFLWATRRAERNPTKSKMPMRCYNCFKPGHRAQSCPDICWRCGGEHWFVKCTSADRREIKQQFDSLDRGLKGHLTTADLDYALKKVKFVKCSVTTLVGAIKPKYEFILNQMHRLTVLKQRRSQHFFWWIPCLCEFPRDQIARYVWRDGRK